MRSIIVCADDAGWSAENDEVIAGLGGDGRISAISILVDGPTAARWHAFSAVERCALGLHFNLTLQPERDSQGLAGVVLGAYGRRLSQAGLAEEFKRQLMRFERMLARPPAFVDGHQHVHMLPGVRMAVLGVLAQRYDAGERPAMRVPLSEAWRGIKAATINLLGARRLAAELRGVGWPANCDFAGVYNMTGPIDYRRRMVGWLSTIRDGGLIMAHPGVATTMEHALARAQESRYFASRHWTDDCRAAGVRLVPFTSTALNHIRIPG